MGKVFPLSLPSCFEGLILNFRTVSALLQHVCSQRIRGQTGDSSSTFYQQYQEPRNIAKQGQKPWQCNAKAQSQISFRILSELHTSFAQINPQLRSNPHKLIFCSKPLESWNYTCTTCAQNPEPTMTEADKWQMSLHRLQQFLPRTLHHQEFLFNTRGSQVRLGITGRKWKHRTDPNVRKSCNFPWSSNINHTLGFGFIVNSTFCGVVFFR